VKPIWILLKQETVSGSGISWAVCKSAPRSIQITTPAPHHSVFYRPDAQPFLPPNQQRQSTEGKHADFITTATEWLISCDKPTAGEMGDGFHERRVTDVVGSTEHSTVYAAVFACRNTLTH